MAETILNGLCACCECKSPSVTGAECIPNGNECPQHLRKQVQIKNDQHNLGGAQHLAGPDS